METRVWTGYQHLPDGYIDFPYSELGKNLKLVNH